MRKKRVDKELKKSEINKNIEQDKCSKVNGEIEVGSESINKNKKSNQNKKNILKKIFILIFVVIIITVISGLVLLYGPYNGFRDWLITTAMSTMEHQYLATFFYSEDIINECLNRNKVIEAQATTNTDLINFIDYSNIRRNYI